MRRALLNSCLKMALTRKCIDVRDRPDFKRQRVHNFGVAA